MSAGLRESLEGGLLWPVLFDMKELIPQGRATLLYSTVEQGNERDRTCCSG